MRSLEWPGTRAMRSTARAPHDVVSDFGRYSRQFRRFRIGYTLRKRRSGIRNSDPDDDLLPGPRPSGQNILTMEQIVGKSTASSSFTAKLVLSFAGLSLLLAAVGLYGVLSYLVTQRTPEIGIRMALGAERERVLRLMLLDGLRPALAGLVLGMAASVAVTRLIRSVLYGTSPLDATVFLLVIVTLLLSSIAACLVPAWRASRIDPMKALRSE